MYSHSRWYHAEVSVTADSVRLSVNHQPATEQPVGVDVVAMLERLTIGGGTASGKIDWTPKNVVNHWQHSNLPFKRQ